MTTEARAAPGRSEILVRRLSETDYEPVWHAMREFTESRDERTQDEIWLTSHHPVFTLGRAGRIGHVLDVGGAALLRSDRGGQVTYHGPGQAVVYTLLDLRRLAIGVRRLVHVLEQSVIDAVADGGVRAGRSAGAPGVYVDHAKLAALGLRVRNARCYHGLALNVDLDLAPFSRIDPCGYPGLAVTSLAELGLAWSVAEAGHRVVASLGALLGRRTVFPAT